MQSLYFSFFFCIQLKIQIHGKVLPTIQFCLPPTNVIFRCSHRPAHSFVSKSTTQSSWQWTLTIVCSFNSSFYSVTLPFLYPYYFPFLFLSFLVFLTNKYGSSHIRGKMCVQLSTKLFQKLWSFYLLLVVKIFNISSLGC